MLQSFVRAQLSESDCDSEEVSSNLTLGTIK
jgi:hypothetical protein